MLRLKGYLITLGVGYLLVFLVNMILSLCGVCGFSVLFCFYYPLLIILAFFALDFLAAGLVRLLPKRKVNIHSKLYKCFGFERRLYEHLGVRWFKTKIPELGGALEGFSKAEMKSDDAQYLEQFIKETILGELTHHLCVLFGILVFFIFPHYILCFALPTFLLNTYFNVLPIIVQRYNRPKLYKIYMRKISQKKEVSNELR